MIRRTIICLLLFSLNAAAQEQEPFDSTSTQDSKLNWMEQLHEVQQLLETRAKAAVDAHYIEVPIFQAELHWGNFS